MKDNDKTTKFINNLIENKKTGKGSQKSAFLKAGFEAKNDQVARSNASRLANSPKVKKQLSDLFDKHGITREVILKKFKMLLESTDQRVVFQMIDMYNKLKDEYPGGKLRVGVLNELDDIYTEADIEERQGE